MDVINRSVNQTLSRTAMTSGLTFLTVLALFLFGGPVLHNFSFALVVGIMIGTYSSVFVASPLVLFWNDRVEARRKTAPVMAAVRTDAPTVEPVRLAVKPGMSARRFVRDLRALKSSMLRYRDLTEQVVNQIKQKVRRWALSAPAGRISQLQRRGRNV